MKITFITVGGTIDKVYFDALSAYEVGDSKVNEILKDARINFNFEVFPILKKDSLDMTDEDRMLVHEVVSDCKNNKIVITHGTDSMVETAKALSKIKDKTIVMTGAMEPAVFKTSDAIFNLGSAVAAVQVLPPGTYIAISGRIFSPDNVKKNRNKKQFEKKM
ncbi:MAG: asparaginase [Desulfobacteraceae bacterium]|nr:asparaginase [Desulfobacteraceae bacterium]